MLSTCCWSVTTWVASAVGLLALVTKAWGIFSRRQFEPKNKHVFVTGGSTGLGLAVAIHFARLGANVTVASRSEHNLQNAKNLLEKSRVTADQKFLAIRCDVVDYAQTTKAIADSVAANGRAVDYLVCSAGLAFPGYFLEQDIATFRAQMDLNYFGCVNAAKAAAPGMIARGSGHICLVSSGIVCFPMIGYTQYCPTKYALRGFADCLRSELCPHNVDVSIFFPANIDSPGYEQENRAKPAETRELEGASTPVSPTSAAACLVANIQSGSYAFSNDFLTRVGLIGCGSLAPRDNIIVDALVAPLVVLLLGVVRVFFDATVSKFAKEKKAAAAKKSN